MRSNILDSLFPHHRQQILATLLPDTERRWYLGDLARHLNVQPSSLQRELSSLTDMPSRKHSLMRSMKGRPKRRPRESGLAVVVIVQNEAETIERSMRSYYDHVDRILVSTDPTRGHSGREIVPDDTIDRIMALDKVGKVDVLRDDFCRYDDPMRNDTYQRQVSADRLAQLGDWRWIFQVDADEVFLDFSAVARQVRGLRFAQAVFWRLVSIFNILPDGRLLVVVDRDGKPMLERFPLAHRPGATLTRARLIDRPSAPIYRIFKWRYEGGKSLKDTVLHYSYAKSERRVLEKLATFGHHAEFDVDSFFRIWQSSAEHWPEMTDFHPLVPTLWPALRPFAVPELAACLGRDVPL
ncbi:MAG: hypothetical protein ACLQVD_05320 [Capsulimonadaceae bacterium]